MGIHYDTLETALNLIPDTDLMKFNIPAKEFLTQLYEKTTLIEFPTPTQQLKQELGMDQDQYLSFLRYHLDGKIPLPFEATAIEDPESVVIMYNIEDNHYLLTSCQLIEGTISLLCGRVTVVSPMTPSGNIPLGISPLYDFHYKGTILKRPPGLDMFGSNDIYHAAMAYMEQAAVIEASNKPIKACSLALYAGP